MNSEKRKSGSGELANITRCARSVNCLIIGSAPFQGLAAMALSVFGAGEGASAGPMHAVEIVSRSDTVMSIWKKRRYENPENASFFARVEKLLSVQASRLQTIFSYRIKPAAPPIRAIIF